MEDTKARAQATIETDLEGNGLTSASEPSSPVSLCQPGKVARRSRTKEEETMAMNLRYKSTVRKEKKKVYDGGVICCLIN